ncbi:zinc ribbon domain-containing protein [Candidatus Giovannonibacteria bacterium]|nr:zinc ribbon domain-containing protein [Candidatus Giovannonibacteria bacterium]
MAEGDGQRRDSRPQYRIVSLSYLRNFVKGDASKIDYRKNDRWDIDVSGVVLYHGKEPPRELKQVELNIGDKTLKTSSQANGKFEFAFSVFEVKEFQARIWLTESPGQIVPLVVTTRERTEIEELEERKCLANLRFEVQQAEERLQKREDILASHETTKCHFCGAEVSEDAHHCERCKSVQRKFKRLCPRCMKEVDTKANKCLHCGNNFPLVVGAERFAYILCGNARCERSNLNPRPS